MTASLSSGAAPPVATPPAWQSALQLACRFGHIEAAKALLEKGADVNRVRWPAVASHKRSCRGGRSPWLGATALTPLDPPRCTQVAPDGTALMEAAAAGCEDIVRMLLENKADPCIGVVRAWVGGRSAHGARNGFRRSMRP
jgi:ankyrin repeat protein